MGLYSKRVDGSSEVELLLAGGDHGWTATSWSHENESLVYSAFAGLINRQGFLQIADRRAQENLPVSDRRLDGWAGQFSPDGDWVAYSHKQGEDYEVYLRRLRDDGSVGREIPVTTLGAGDSHWHQSGGSQLTLRYLTCCSWRL